MLAAPNTWTPCDSAHRISLCQTGSTRSNTPSISPIARGAPRAARSTSPTAAGGSTVQSSRARISAAGMVGPAKTTTLIATAVPPAPAGPGA